MSIDIGSKTLAGQERTARVTRVTPADGNYRLIIERERVFKNDQGVVVTRQDVNPGLDLAVSTVVANPATATYLAACKAANSIQDLIQAEAAWYDALVAASRAPSA